MSFLKELQGKRNALKKTEPSRRERENLEELIVKDEDDYDRLMRETYFEEYYDHIEKFTFKSTIVPLTLEEIQAIHETYHDLQVDLTSVEAKVEEGISTIRRKANKECQVFVRLSSRSPKDAIFHMEGFPVGFHCSANLVINVLYSFGETLVSFVTYNWAFVLSLYIACLLFYLRLSWSRPYGLFLAIQRALLSFRDLLIWAKTQCGPF